MARLPIVGSDDGAWGDILNDYLSQSLAADGSLKNDTVGAPQIKSLAVTSAHVAPGAILADKLQDGSVSAGKLQDDSVSAAKLQDASVSTSKLQDASVSSSKLQDGSIATGALQDASVSASKLQNNSVATSSLQDGSVTTGKLQDAGVTAAKLQDGSVLTAKLQDAGVTSSKLQDASVTTAKLHDASVTTGKLAAFGVANGVAGLDAQAKLPIAQVPDLSATYASTAMSLQKWQPSTSYSLGQQVVSSNNDIISATEAHTSGASYDAAKWALSTSFAAAERPAMQRFRAAIADRNNKAIVIGMAGSSTTYGNNATAPGYRFVNLLAEAIHDTYPVNTKNTRYAVRSLAGALTAAPLASGVHVVNAGVIGAESSNYLTATTGPQMASLSPSLMIHMVGANDFASGVSLATYRSNIEARLAQLKSDIAVPCVHLLVHPYQRYDSFTPVANWAEYGKVLEAIAAADPQNVAFVNLSSYFETIGIPGSDKLGYMAPDKIHLTNSGHAYLADVMATVLGVKGNPRPYRYSRIASDAFTGSNSTDISSRVLDGTYGGMQKTWTSSPAAAFGITSNALVAGGTPAAAFLSVSAPPRDLEISVTVTTKPSASAGVYLDLRRESSALSGTSSSYRLLMADTTVVIIKRVSGTTTTLGTNVLYNNGDRVTLRCIGSRIDVLINGVVADSVNDTSVTSGGFAGIATSGAGPHVLDDVVIDAITQ